MFIEGLLRTGTHVTTESLLSTLNHNMANIDIGLGVPLGLSTVGHQASHTVWGSELQPDRTFDVLSTWDPVARVQSD